MPSLQSSPQLVAQVCLAASVHGRIARVVRWRMARQTSPQSHPFGAASPCRSVLAIGSRCVAVRSALPCLSGRRAHRVRLISSRPRPSEGGASALPHTSRRQCRGMQCPHQCPAIYHTKWGFTLASGSPSAHTRAGPLFTGLSIVGTVGIRRCIMFRIAIFVKAEYF